MNYDPIDHDLERGLQNRRQILGDAWVDRSIGNATNFNAEFQHLITRFAWDEIWSRPGLEKQTRRIIVLAITMSLGRWEEFELHVRAALLGDPDTRLTPDELKEVLIQTAVYAGVPAANTGFTHAQKILREIGPQIGYELEPASIFEARRPGAAKEAVTHSKPALHYSMRPARNQAPAPKTIVLSHALGCDLSMWNQMADFLAADYNVVAYDHRGHGSSGAPLALYSMEELADDAQRLLRELACGPVIWIGLSMGGMVGQELAIRHPSLVAALVIANSTSEYPDAVRAVWQQRIETVRAQGIEVIADAVMERYFHEGFRKEHAGAVAAFRRRLTATDQDGYIGCCNAVGAVDTTRRLSQIKIPTLVIAGELDQGAPVAMSETITSQIPGSQLVVIPEASHLAVTEQPKAFAQAVGNFLGSLA